ncbi:UDP-glucose 4-epimerase GalE [Achromobacter sp. DH1f]|uniref:UDP-glucose 4-epimerase GalE n=1 Tax=Achromobacter sp. DH1f TaxID=1397275 RepID=UPI0004A81B28|nr:UDP-glucose 4-epimerase GalE [Achromobacter sp. DH1f]
MQTTIFVTGGAGYIGVHTLVCLLEAGHRILVLDDFSNSSPQALARVEEITGIKVPFVQGDVRDTEMLKRLFADCAAHEVPVSCVLHLAALKAVGESVSLPLKYYDVNVTGTLSLLEAMRTAGVKRIVFSSSATVYRPETTLPYTEQHAIGPSNPYGQTKAMVEQILQDFCHADRDFSAIALRYFNPIGAHHSGRIGDHPAGIPNNLFPYITRTAIGSLPVLPVFGTDYSTVDGSGVRDYIHVSDLATGHVKAIDWLCDNDIQGFHPFNLGTGRGTSVLELIDAFETANGVAVPYEVRARRSGDSAEAWADVSAANLVLNWRAQHTIEDMCRDGWNWQQKNPSGYEK